MSDNSHLCPAVMPLEDSFCLSETTACNECSCPVERAFKLQTRLEHRNLLQDYSWSSLLIQASQFRDEEAEKIVPHSRSGTFTKQWLGFPGEASGKESNCQRRRHKTRVWSLGQEDPLQEGLATLSSILAWRILWTEEPGGLQYIGLQRVGHDWSNLAKIMTVVCTIGEGSGTPLQSSCLENTMGRGAWWAAVHGVSKSQTRLSDFTFTHWRRKWQPTPVFLPGESQGRRSLVGCCLWDCNRVGHDRSDLAAEVCTKC